MFDVSDMRLARLVKSVGFINHGLEETVQAYLNWHGPLLAERKVQLERRNVGRTFENGIKTLLPLTNIEPRRYIFFPTRSAWTGYLDNSFLGTDAMPPMSYLAKTLRCNSMRLVYADHKPALKQWGACILEMFGPVKTDWLNVTRAIAVACDGGKWRFIEGGTPQPFEQMEKYSLPRVKDRFTWALLVEYARSLGIELGDKTFVEPGDRDIILLEKVGPAYARMQEFEI